MYDKENLGMRDQLIIKVLDKDGNVKSQHEDYDLITNAGIAAIAQLIGGGSTNAFKYVAIGTGTTAAAAGDTALGTEVLRTAGTVSYTTTTVTNDTVQIQATFSKDTTPSNTNQSAPTGTAAITESGVFDDGTAGNMLCHQVFSAINVNWDNGDSIQITWKIQISS